MRPNRKHLLKTALHDSSTLRKHLRNGIGALAPVDVKLIAESERSKIGDSLDLDTATKDELPEANRWDYLMSLPALEQIIGVEPHTARDSEISVVIAKKKHALQYLRSHLQDGYHIAKWFWVSHGTVGFSRMDRARRLLDQNGIAFVGRSLRKLG
jgi:hypothetical protein